jgi:phenylalanine-4-hydroxylase
MNTVVESYSNFKSQPQKELGQEGTETWQRILSEHSQTREAQVCDLFHKGLKLLNISKDHIPTLTEINAMLKELTGFEGVFVDGLEDANSFYPLLANRKFPVGNFIRDKQDITYTPEPDIVHDMYGHLPFFTDKPYADFCQKFGEMASHFINQPEALRQFERFFWFTIEFGLIKTAQGLRVFGAGIASSTGECEYALSGKPKVLPFNVDIIRHQEFRIDIMQETLFVLESYEQLYQSLDTLHEKVSNDFTT